MYSQEVRLQLDTTWFQGKHVNIWVMLQCVHRTVFAEVPPGDALKLEGESECQECVLITAKFKRNVSWQITDS